jgi:hypothetical protein
MGTIRQHNEGGWRLLAPSGFPKEAALHDIVEQAPHLLPLSGSPQLVVDGTGNRRLGSPLPIDTGTEPFENRRWSDFGVE